jgi:hypothetical protein
MSNSEIFANTISEWDLGTMASSVMNECEKFGMTWGCRAECPAFNKGNCKDVYYENIITFIDSGDLYEDEALKFVDMYKHKLTLEQSVYLLNKIKEVENE